MHLDKFDNSGFDRGKPVLVEVLWRIIEGLFFKAGCPDRAGGLRCCDCSARRWELAW